MRADIYLVQHGHYESRARAQAAIKAGLVVVNGKLLKKPSDKIPDNAVIKAGQDHPWVSRGGMGGFTDVLIQKGAAHIYAVDVGHGQLHRRLIGHQKISSMEGQDARNLTAASFPQAPQLIVCDASFISAMKVLAVPLSLAANAAELVTLVKPQFEVGKAGIGKGGIVKSEAAALAALAEVKDWVAAQGWEVLAAEMSPIKGGSGNTEHLLHARKS